MKFQSISLKNFGVFLKDEITFAYKPKGKKNKIVTFVVGQNGTGKTTLANAMKWCLFGETNFSDQNSIVAIDALKQVAIGEDVTVSVSVKLEHQNISYIFERQESFRRTGDNLDGRAVCQEIRDTLTFVSTSHKQNGEIVTIKQDSDSADKPVDAIVDKICPEKLRAFIFFNGERIGELARSFEQGSANANSKNAAAETIKTAVKTLLGLEAFYNGAQHLKGRIAQGTQVVSRLLDIELSKLSDPALQNNVENMNKLEDEIKSLEKEISDLKNKLNSYEESCDTCEETIRKNEDADKLYRERERLNEEIQTKEKQQENIYSLMLDRLADVVKGIAAKRPASQALEKVRGIAPTTDALPFLRAETIDALLERGRCICGHEILEGSVEEKTLLKLKETLPPHSLSNSLGDFIKATRERFSNIEFDDAPQKFIDYYNSAQDYEKIIEEAKGKVEGIDRQLDGAINFDKRVSKARDLLRAFQKEIQKINGSIAFKDEKIKDNLLKIDTYRRELVNDEKNKGQKAFFKRCIKYVDAVYDRLLDYYSKNEEKVIERLDKKVKETFALLGLRNEIPSIGRDYVFRCTEQSGIPTRLAESLSFIAALSTITAIIRLGKELVAEDENLSAAVIGAVPLVMDAPLSTFDTKRIEAFGNRMPDIVDQLIIFTKDTEGAIVKPFMADHIGVEYTIVSDSSTRSHFEKVED